MIRVLVVDDHDAVRTSLAMFLEIAAGIEVVGEAANGREAVALCEALRPDVVLMDVRLPVLGGIAATALIKDAHAATRVILLTAYEQPELAAAGRECGADALAFKGIVGAELADLVRTVGASGRSAAEEAA